MKKCLHLRGKEFREYDTQGKLIAFSAHCEDCGESWPKFQKDGNK